MTSLVLLYHNELTYDPYSYSTNHNELNELTYDPYSPTLQPLCAYDRFNTALS